ncbi:hypothetical protein D3C77_571670 [compost metagenome]
MEKRLNPFSCVHILADTEYEQCRCKTKKLSREVFELLCAEQNADTILTTLKAHGVNNAQCPFNLSKPVNLISPEQLIDLVLSL